MGGGLVQKTRNFLSSRPPLVVFVFCIGLTGVAFVSFAYYIKYNGIKNFEIKEDWNTFLHNTTKINFCPLNDTTYRQSSEYGQKNISISLDATLNIPAQTSFSITPVSAFQSVINASQLGFFGDIANRSVKFIFAMRKPVSLSCTNEDGCVTSLSTCLTIQGPSEIFPTSLKPTTCSLHVNESLPIVELSGNLPPEEGSFDECSSFLIKLNHEDEEKLIVYLTVETRSKIHMRVLNGSYILFIFAAVVLVFGVLKSSSIVPHHHERLQTYTSGSPLR